MAATTDYLDPIKGRAPLVEGGEDYESITNIVAGVVERKPPIGWYRL